MPISETLSDPTASTGVTAVYQLVFATKRSTLAECLLRGGDDTPVDFTYAFWVVRRESGVVLVDTGFGPDVARRRGIEYQRRPVDALAALGIGPDEVTDVIVTHLHFDHAGGLAAFPRARVHVQRSDLDFYTGPYMRFPLCSGAVEHADMATLEQLADQGRLHQLDGGQTIYRGIDVHHVGGHTPGSQVVHLTSGTARVVLASDVAHLYDNLERGLPFPVLHDLPSCCEAFEEVERLSAGGARVIPGHDGRVMERFPRIEGPGAEFVVRLA